MYYDVRAIPELEQRLAGITHGRVPENVEVLATETYVGKALKIVFGGAILAAPAWFMARQNYVPEDMAALLTAAPALVGALLVVSGVRGAVRLMTARIRPALILNPVLLVWTDGTRRVGFFRLSELEDASYRMDILFTFRLRFRTGKVRFKMGRKFAAEQFWHRIVARRDEAQARPADLMSPDDWLAGLAEREIPPRRAPMRLLRGLARFATALAAAAAVTVAAIGPAWVACARHCEAYAWENTAGGESGGWEWYLRWALSVDPTLPPPSMKKDWRDAYAWRRDEPVRRAVLGLTPFRKHVEEARAGYDDASYREAVAKRTAEALREYRAQFPGGRHAAESREALRELFRRAEEAYVARAIKAGAAPQAVEGMRRLLARLRESDDEAPEVPVAFLPVEGLEGQAVEKAVAEETGSSKVQPVGPSFTAAHNTARHGRIVGRLDGALRRVIGDLVKLRWDDAAREPRFAVRYRVAPSGVWYTVRSEDARPLNERTIFVGIQLGFELALEIDGARFPAPVTAQPAPNFTVRDVSASTVYDTMVDTAFQEFQEKAAVAFGIGAGRED